MATFKVQLRPFTVPNFVLPAENQGRREDGLKPLPGIAISELDYETLSQMCDDFKAEVMKKAGK